MKYFKLLSVATSIVIFASTPTHAKIAGNYCIDTIEKVLENLPFPPKNSIAVFDWDRTISKKEGGYSPREEETLTVIQTLQKKGFKNFVLTARLKGHSASGAREKLGMARKKFDALVDEQVVSMLDVVGKISWLGHGGVQGNHYEEEAIPDAEGADGRQLYAVSRDQIIFAGGVPIKGKTLAHFIDSNKLKFKPENIVFIENAIYNIDEVREVFKDRPENVYLYRYPSIEGKIIDDEPCKR